jgi:cell division protein FtsN
MTAPAQRGAFLPGFLAGLVTGLALALAVALYVTKTPVPFLDKLPQRTAEQDAAEAAKNRNWDPNAALPGKSVRPPPPSASAAAGASAPAAKAAASAVPGPGPVARDPAAILAGAAVPAAPAAPASAARGEAKAGEAKGDAKAGAPRPGELYLVQAGAFQRVEEAEAQRAKVSLLGLDARVVERAQASGRTVYRVRLGPFDKPAEAEAARERLASSGVEAVVLRAERGTP